MQLMRITNLEDILEKKKDIFIEIIIYLLSKSLLSNFLPFSSSGLAKLSSLANVIFFST